MSRDVLASFFTSHCATTVAYFDVVYIPLDSTCFLVYTGTVISILAILSLASFCYLTAEYVSVSAQ